MAGLYKRIINFYALISSTAWEIPSARIRPIVSKSMLYIPLALTRLTQPARIISSPEVNSASYAMSALITGRDFQLGRPACIGLIARLELAQTKCDFTVRGYKVCDQALRFPQRDQSDLTA